VRAETFSSWCLSVIGCRYLLTDSSENEGRTPLPPFFAQNLDEFGLRGGPLCVVAPRVVQEFRADWSCRVRWAGRQFGSFDYAQDCARRPSAERSPLLARVGQRWGTRLVGDLAEGEVGLLRSRIY